MYGTIYNIRQKLRASDLITTEPFIYLLLFCALIAVLNPHHLIKDISEMDEIWNYQYARRILYGQIPYKDFAILQTPFAPQLNAMFLKIFGDKLIVMRWTASVLTALNCMLAYKIMRIVGKNHLLAFMWATLTLFPYIRYPQNNYSWYVVFFLSLALMLEISRIKDDINRQIKYELWIGIALGLTLITKQNIGIAGILASTMFLIYSKKLGANCVFQSLMLRAMGFIIVVGTELLYLGLNMNLGWLISTMTSSLLYFAGSSSYPYYRLLFEDYLTQLLAIWLPSFIVISLVKGLHTDKELTKKTLILVSLYATANFCMVIPIADVTHLLFGMHIPILAAAAMIDNRFQESQKNRVILSSALLIALTFSIMFGIFNQTHQTTSEITHYECISLSADKERAIIDMGKLICNEEAGGRTIFLLNYKSAAFLIPLDKFNYRYDTIGKGTPAETEIINLLASTPNATVIISSQNSMQNWQETEKIGEYTRETMQYLTSLHGFDVYRKR